MTPHATESCVLRQKNLRYGAMAKGTLLSKVAKRNYVAGQLLSQVTVLTPANVISREPPKFAPIAASAPARRPDCMRNTTSAEKVEKVVKPPQKPVVMNSRHSGAKAGYCMKNASATP